MQNMTVLDYHPRNESLIENAAGLVTMGGYNTFCEILSFNKPTIIVPRTAPRTEQLIRARRAAELGLTTMLPNDADAKALRGLLENLSTQPPPADNLQSGMLAGMDNMCERIVSLLNT